MVGRSLGRPFRKEAVGNGGHILERRVGFDDEPVAEIRRHTARVLGRIAHDMPHIGQHTDLGTGIEGVDDQIGTFGLGIGQAEHRGTLGGRDLHRHVVIGEVGAVIIGLRHLGLMRKPTGAGVLVEHRGPR